MSDDVYQEFVFLSNRLIIFINASRFLGSLVIPFSLGYCTFLGFLVHAR